MPHNASPAILPFVLTVAFRVKLGANDLNYVDVPLNPTHSLTLTVVLVVLHNRITDVCLLFQNNSSAGNVFEKDVGCNNPRGEISKGIPVYFPVVSNAENSEISTSTVNLSSNWSGSGLAIYLSAVLLCQQDDCCSWSTAPI